MTKLKCPVCGKEYDDVPGIRAGKRLIRHIGAVHGKKWLDQVTKKGERE